MRLSVGLSIVLLLLSCGPSSQSSSNNELLKLGLVGLACSATSNPGACLDGAAKSGSTNKNTGSRSTTSSRSSSTDRRTTSSSTDRCTSDFSCSFSEKCVKKPGRYYGICMTEVNRYGTKTYNGPSSSSIGIRSYNSSSCTFNTDCPIGFKCDREYKVCVK